MQTERCTWTSAGGWSQGEGLRDADWVLYFAAPEAPAAEIHRQLRERYPSARLLGCTTGGEIAGSEVHDGSVSAVAMKFDAVATRGAWRAVSGSGSSFEVGASIGHDLRGSGLRAVFVLSDGTQVNGTELVQGLRSTLGDGVVITGGLAGDGARFG